MVLFNYSTKELTAKIVYYGPGLCGKTTNLQFIFDSLPDEKKGRMLSLSTQTDRTLYFDFLPVELGTIRGMKTRMQLYTVPGQVFYNETRKMVLKGVDGVVFVADSQSQVAGANLESFKNLEENLREHGLDLASIPLVLQYNKRDLPSIQPVEEMNTSLNRYNAPFYEAIATTGIGVHDTLKAISKLVLLSLSGDKEPLRSKAPPPQATPPAPPPPPVETPATESDAMAWGTDGLDEMLEQMDADEIQGLLEEVDEFGEPAAASATAPQEAVLDGDGAEGPMATTDDLGWETPAAGSPLATARAGGEDETSFAELGPDLGPDPGEHSIWLGEEETGEEAGDAASLEEQAPTAEDTLAAAFEAQDLATSFEAQDDPGPLEAGAPDDDLFATPPQEPEAAAGDGDEEALTFESFVAEERSRRSGAGPTLEEEPETGPWTTGSGDDEDEESWPGGAAEHAAEEEPADTAPPPRAAVPRLATGTPVINGNGMVKVPLRVQVGGQTYAYTLTVSVDADPEGDAGSLA